MARRLLLAFSLTSTLACATGGDTTASPARAERPCGRAAGDEAALRTELFVTDLAKSVAFYKNVLGFRVAKESVDYIAVCRGGVVFGLGPVAKVATNHYFSPEVAQARKGLGVELVIEVDDVAAAERHVRATGYPLVKPLQTQRWGLTDFRLADPDGYFLRVTSR